VRKGIRFKETKLQLKKGDALFFYTDGVTDALNRKKQPFGEEGVQEMLGSLKKNASVHQDMRDIITTLQTYIKGAKRVDDIATVFFKKTS
jgi:sigma-B regulation protein RsbU (phosphoserine phosphatase)